MFTTGAPAAPTELQLQKQRPGTALAPPKSNFSFTAPFAFALWPFVRFDASRERALFALGAIGFVASVLVAPESSAGISVMWTAGAFGAFATHLGLKAIKGGPLELEDMCH